MTTAIAPATLYDQLEERVLPLLDAYHDDLTRIDREWLEKNPSVPFLHLTRSHGTHIIGLPPADHPGWPARGEVVRYMFGHATREHMLEQVGAIFDGIRATDKIRLTLFYNGSTLQEITLDWAEQLVNAYTKSVRHAWQHAT